MQKVFQECKMIAVVQNNASNAEDLMVLKHRLHKHGMAVKLFPNQVVAKMELLLLLLLFVLIGLGWN